MARDAADSHDGWRRRQQHGGRSGVFAGTVVAPLMLRKFRALVLKTPAPYPHREPTDLTDPQRLSEYPCWWEDDYWPASSFLRHPSSLEPRGRATGATDRFLDRKEPATRGRPEEYHAVATVGRDRVRLEVESALERLDVAALEVILQGQ